MVSRAQAGRQRECSHLLDSCRRARQLVARALDPSPPSQLVSQVRTSSLAEQTSPNAPMPTGWRSTYRLEKENGRRQLSSLAKQRFSPPPPSPRGWGRQGATVSSRCDFEDCAKDAQLYEVCHGKVGVGGWFWGERRTWRAKEQARGAAGWRGWGWGCCGSRGRPVECCWTGECLWVLEGKRESWTSRVTKA